MTSTSVDTGTTTGTLLDLASTGGTTATMVLGTFSALTSGIGVSLALNALTTGQGIKVSHTSSVIADGGSLVRITSTSVDTGGATNGVLLDLSSTGSTTGIQILGTFSALTSGTGMSLIDSSADTSARQVALFKVTNTAATGSVPIKTSNVAVNNSKFTRILTATDGTKTVTIWLSQDNTSPNTVLTGTAGDICLNGPSSRSFYCTGTTNWSASNA